MDVSSPGPLCKEIGLYGEMLAFNTIALMPIVDQRRITKGVVLELNQFRKSNNFSWNNFHAWMTALCPRSTLPSLAVMKSSIYRIESKVKQLKRNHHNDDVNLLTNKPFITTAEHNDESYSSLEADGEVHSNSLTSTNQRTLPKVKTCDDRYDSEVLTTVNKALACELSKVQNELEQEVAKTDDLTANLSKLSVCNTNKKLKHRDEKIVELKEQIKDQEKLYLSLDQAKAHVGSYQNRSIAKNQYDTITQKCDHLQVVAKDLNKEVETFKGSLHDSENKYFCMLKRLQELESHMFESKEHQRNI